MEIYVQSLFEGFCVFWEPDEKAANYVVELHMEKFGMDNYTRKSLFLIKKDIVDRNSCFFSMKNILPPSNCYETDNGFSERYRFRFYVVVISEDREGNELQRTQLTEVLMSRAIPYFSH